MSSEATRALIRRYFDAMRAASRELPDLLTDDVSWWVPPSSPLGGLHAGKAKVLALMAQGVGLYDGPRTHLRGARVRGHVLRAAEAVRLERLRDRQQGGREFREPAAESVGVTREGREDHLVGAAAA